MVQLKFLSNSYPTYVIYYEYMISLVDSNIQALSDGAA